MRLVTISIEPVLYHAIENLIQNSQFQTVDEYVHALVQTAVPTTATTNKKEEQNNKEEKKAKKSNDADVDSLLHLMEEYGVFQKDLASFLGVSIPAINVQIKTTHPQSRTKLRKSLNELGVEGVFVESWKEALFREGFETFTSAKIEIQEPKFLICLYYGYALWAFTGVLAPASFYKASLEYFKTKENKDNHTMIRYITQERDFNILKSKLSDIIHEIHNYRDKAITTPLRHKGSLF